MGLGHKDVRLKCSFGFEVAPEAERKGAAHAEPALNPRQGDAAPCQRQPLVKSAAWQAELGRSGRINTELN